MKLRISAQLAFSKGMIILTMCKNGFFHNTEKKKPPPAP